MKIRWERVIIGYFLCNKRMLENTKILQLKHDAKSITEFQDHAKHFYEYYNREKNFDLEEYHAKHPGHARILFFNFLLRGVIVCNINSSADFLEC